MLKKKKGKELNPVIEMCGSRLPPRKSREGPHIDRDRRRFGGDSLEGEITELVLRSE